MSDGIADPNQKSNLPPLRMHITLVETQNEDVKLADALAQVLDNLAPVKLESLVGMDDHVSRRLRVLRWLMDAEMDLADRVESMNAEAAARERE